MLLTNIMKCFTAHTKFRCNEIMCKLVFFCFIPYTYTDQEVAQTLKSALNIKLWKSIEIVSKTLVDGTEAHKDGDIAPKSNRSAQLASLYAMVCIVLISYCVCSNYHTVTVSACSNARHACIVALYLCTCVFQKNIDLNYSVVYEQQ